MRLTTLAIFLLLSQSFVAGQQLRRGTVTDVETTSAGLIVTELRNAGDCGKLFSYHNPQLHYLSCDGKTQHVYDMEKIDPKFKDGGDMTPAFTSDGSSVYALFGHSPDPHKELVYCYAARFDVDGTYRGAVRLDGEYVDCTQITMRDHNTLVLAAIGTDEMPFIGLFQTNGQLIKRLEVKGDLTLTDNENQALDAKLVFHDAEKFRLYLQVTQMDHDDQGNVMLLRHSPADTNSEQMKEPNIIFIITRSGDVKRFELPKPKKKIGLIQATPWIFHGRIVVLMAEANDTAERMETFLREYDFDGKEVSEHRFEPQLLGGTRLLDWDGRRALFLSEGGHQGGKARQLAIIEGY